MSCLLINYKLADDLLGKCYFQFFVCKPITAKEKLEKYNKRLAEIKKQKLTKENIVKELRRLYGEQNYR